jgi:hypothetical protein
MKGLQQTIAPTINTTRGGAPKGDLQLIFYGDFLIFNKPDKLRWRE